MAMTTRMIPAVFLSLLVGVSALAAGDYNSFKTHRGTVVKIVDGDTIRFMPNDAKDDEKAWSIRMISSDTPETHLPGKGGPFSQGVWGEEAHDKLASLLKLGETVEVDDYGIDRYGRVLGRIWKRGNIDVNLAMVKSGWATLYIICDNKSCDDKPEYRNACLDAQDHDRGVYNPHHRLPQMPFVFRSVKQNRPFAKFVGNAKTKRYYQPDQYGRVPVCDRTFFMTETDARREGYTKVQQ